MTLIPSLCTTQLQIPKSWDQILWWRNLGDMSVSEPVNSCKGIRFCLSLPWLLGRVLREEGLPVGQTATPEVSSILIVKGINSLPDRSQHYSFSLLNILVNSIFIYPLYSLVIVTFYL